MVVVAIAGAVAALATAATHIGKGKRQSRDQWGEHLDPTDFQYDNPTSTIIVGAGMLVLIVIIVAIARK